MCSNYRPVTRMDRVLTFFGIERERDEPTPPAKSFFKQWDGPRHGDAIWHMKSYVTMADYHFRVNAERLGVDVKHVTIRTLWGDGEWRFVIEAPASEETLSLAWDKAVRLVGLQCERVAGSGEGPSGAQRL